MVQTGWWADPRPVRPLPEEADRWLTRHPDAVLLSLGSLAQVDPEEQVAQLVAVAARVGAPAVVQVHDARPGPREVPRPTQDGARPTQDDAQHDERVAERAHLLPEEIAVGSDDPAAQAEQILDESDDRTDHPARTQQESPQAYESDAGNRR